MKEIVINENEAGQRLDKFLGKLLKEAPASFYYKMLRKKNIVLNGKKATGKYRQKHTEQEKDPQIPQVLSKPEPSGTFSGHMELTLLPSSLHSPRGSQTLWPP